ncbi:TPA: formylmethanofuran dehydrogenase [Candidatus Micrarchaeota archaeon]|nr:formylmethanofuran dehydrogenase [Candidatus Micrarchaeota archaeon]
MLLEHRINLKDFHGHLGPYAVVGYKMGQLALELLEARGKKLKALARCGTRPPISCMIDGIQFSTPCTLGKGNIEVLDEGKAQAVFSGERTITITLKDSVKENIDSNMSDGEAMAMRVWGMSKEELFEVS